jgi:hypothetical protein
VSASATVSDERGDFRQGGSTRVISVTRAEIKLGDTMLDAPTDREVARQERMKREG